MRNIPTVKTWIVRVMDEHGKQHRSAEVDTINKRFAIWCAQDLGLYLRLGQSYRVSLKQQALHSPTCTCLHCAVKKMEQGSVHCV